MILVFLVACVACGGPSTDAKDSATTAGSTTTDPCALGEVLDEGTATCVAERCGSGRWGPLDADGDVLYVDAAEEAGGDGTEDAPFTDLPATIAAIEAPTTVRVAAGTYPGVLTFDRQHDGIRVIGRCSELVTLDPSLVSDLPSILVDGARNTTVEVSGFHVTGHASWGIHVPKGQFTLSDVQLENQEVVGMAIESDAVVDLEDVSLVGTRQRDGASGHGLEVVGGGVLSARNLVVSGSHEAALVFLDDGTNVDIVGLEVSDTQPTAEGLHGYGLFASTGAVVTITQGVVDGSHERGIDVTGGAEVSLEHVEVLGTVPDDVGESTASVESSVLAHVTATDLTVRDGVGFGLHTSVGGTIDVTGLTLSDYQGVALHAGGADSRIDVDGATISAMPASEEGLAAVGAMVEEGGTITLKEAELSEVTGLGAAVLAPGSMTISDSLIHDIHLASATNYAACALAQYGGTLEIRDSALSRCEGVALYAYGEGTRVDVTGSTIEEVTPLPLLEGTGIRAESRAVVAVTDSTIRECHGNGASALGEDAELILDTVQVEDIVPDDDGRFGRGIELGDGGLASLVDSTILRATEDGVMASGEGSSLVLHNVDILDTQRGPVTTFANGATAQLYATLDAEDVTITGTGGPGIYVTAYALGTCRRCEITGNQFAGVLSVAAAHVELYDSTVADNTEDENLGGGVGVWVDGSIEEAWATMEDITVSGHPFAGVWGKGPVGLAVSGGRIEGGAGTDWRGNIVHGNALYLTDVSAPWDGVHGAALSGTELADSRLAVLLDGSTVTLTGVAWEGNDLDLLQQSCSESLAPPDVAPVGAVLCPSEDQEEITVDLTWDFYLSESSAE